MFHVDVVQAIAFNLEDGVWHRLNMFISRAS